MIKAPTLSLTSSQQKYFGCLLLICRKIVKRTSVFKGPVFRSVVAVVVVVVVVAVVVVAAAAVVVVRQGNCNT